MVPYNSLNRIHGWINCEKHMKKKKQIGIKKLTNKCPSKERKKFQSTAMKISVNDTQVVTKNVWISRIIIQEKPPHKKSMPVTQHYQPRCEDSLSQQKLNCQLNSLGAGDTPVQTFYPERETEREEASWMKYQWTGWHWGLPPPIQSRALPVYDYIIISSLRLYLTTKLSFPIKPRNLVILFSLPTIRRYSDFKWTGQYITYLSHFLLISSLFLFFRCLNSIFFSLLSSTT